MRKIILASGSKARAEMLKGIGLKFKVCSSGVVESMSLVKGGGRLVIENALQKARDVADRHKTGIVIGADTVVVVGKKVIGKPKDRKEAFRTLKLLTRRPQYVFSGIAVIDIDSAKTFTAYEKTKVYMMPLSDGEIKKYINKITPMNHAGSFDIQGLGGMFVRRIEGCYYTVVGLPLMKLGKILGKLGIDVF